jgi:hypothetical protein
LIAWGQTALGPRDRFFAAASGTDLTIDFPEWYLPRVAAAGPLDGGHSGSATSTPLTDSLDSAFRLLLPVVLGGGV